MPFKVPRLTKGQLQSKRESVRLPRDVAGQRRKPPGSRTDLRKGK